MRTKLLPGLSLLVGLAAHRRRKVLDQAYNAEIKPLEPHMELRMETVQAILDDVVPSDARAKKFKPQELYDRRHLAEMEKSGFFDKL